MTLDLNKPVQTRDGRKARILCPDRVPPTCEKATPIVALVERDGGETVYTYFENGALSENMSTELDLINVQEVE